MRLKTNSGFFNSILFNVSRIVLFPTYLFFTDFNGVVSFISFFLLVKGSSFFSLHVSMFSSFTSPMVISSTDIIGVKYKSHNWISFTLWETASSFVKISDAIWIFFTIFLNGAFSGVSVSSFCSHLL